jgi:hydroxyethylthiazole kinase-like sugar kinase family protein
MRAPQSDPSHIAADVIERLRERAPRVHCITNAVAQAYTAFTIMGIAGELAAERARGPGTFAIEIIDAVYGLKREDLLARARVTERGAQ